MTVLEIPDLICSNCLETVSETEQREGSSPCCLAIITEDVILSKVNYLSFYMEFNLWLETSPGEKAKILEHVSGFSADSKKRRKSYPRVENPWPGRLSSATSKKAMRQEGTIPRKRPPTTKRPLTSLDIKSDTDGHTVIITGLDKNPTNISGKDRSEARKKARSYLRSRGSSITLAEAIEEGNGVTNIHYDNI